MDAETRGTNGAVADAARNGGGGGTEPPLPSQPHHHHPPLRPSKSLGNMLSAALHRFGRPPTPLVVPAAPSYAGASAPAPQLLRPLSTQAIGLGRATAPVAASAPSPPPLQQQPHHHGGGLHPEAMVARITSALLHPVHHGDAGSGLVSPPGLKPDEADEDAALPSSSWPASASAYELLDECGRGASAVVYRARCLALGGREVSVKVVDLDDLLQGQGGGGGGGGGGTGAGAARENGGGNGNNNNDDDGGPLAAVVREAATQAAFRHPNVLPLLVSFLNGSELWLVTPYMAGGSVAHVMRYAHPKGLAEPLVATIALGVLRALAYVHAHGGIHRDVKAGNVLLAASGRARLGDFGVVANVGPWAAARLGGGGGGGGAGGGGAGAAVLSAAAGGSWGSTTGPRNTFAGTPCWMAPEVMEQDDTKGYGSSADIWSFGITLLELANGHAPFAHLPPLKVLLLTLQGPPPQLEETAGSGGGGAGSGAGGPGSGEDERRFSRAMREVVALCLQKDPSRRPSAAQLLRHRWFARRARDDAYVRRHLLAGLPPLPERVREIRAGLRGPGRGAPGGGFGAGGLGVNRGAAAPMPSAAMSAAPLPLPPLPPVPRQHALDKQRSMDNYASDLANWDFSCVLEGEEEEVAAATARAGGDELSAAAEAQAPPPVVVAAVVAATGGGPAGMEPVVVRLSGAGGEGADGGATTPGGLSAAPSTRAPSPSPPRERSGGGGGGGGEEEEEEEEAGPHAPPPSEVSSRRGARMASPPAVPPPPPPTRRQGRFTVWEGARVEGGAEADAPDDGGGGSGGGGPRSTLLLSRRRSLSSPDLRRDWAGAQRAAAVAAAAAAGPPPPRALGGRRVGFRGDVVGGEEEEERGAVAAVAAVAAAGDATAAATTIKGRFKVSSPPQA